ncbi:uncharacterized protein BXIN_0986 [Babesia sp. Xinjiang]|uniref:uncharacterized protein n=1 Tax=Babesia sp. Xinjiang TaxID=462227 RepID=UPI000A2608B8|nr:uncharacterized protein BXIN_0986 [Babesia sp. Xinjiang]ORM42228.1 hypothetical protein BXIN_0986 [Babesia sp. Xinjiang]
MSHKKHKINVEISLWIFVTLILCGHLLSYVSAGCAICSRGTKFDQCVQDKRKHETKHYTDSESCTLSQPLHIKLYGDLHNLAYYYTYIEVGTPTQRQTVVVDTGSSNLMLSDAESHHCGHHDLAAFDPACSETTLLISGKSSQCAVLGGKSRRNGKNQNPCTFEQDYAENSNIRGLYVSDYFMFESDIEPNVNYMVPQLGCVTSETKLIYHQRANGVLGLGPSEVHGEEQDCMDDSEDNTTSATKSNARKGNEMSTSQQPDTVQITNSTNGPSLTYGNFVNDFLHKHFLPKQHQFSLCLSDKGGWMTIGGFDASPNLIGGKYRDGDVQHSSNGPIWVPMDLTGVYSISVEFLEFAGYVMKPNSTKFILDSGSTYSDLEPAMYKIIHSFYRHLCNTIQLKTTARRTKRRTSDSKDFIETMHTTSSNKPKHEDTAAFSENETGQSEGVSNHSSTDSGAEAHLEYILHAAIDLQKKLDDKVRCTIQKHEKFICFSDISQMPSVYLVVHGKRIRWYPESYFIRRPGK